MKVKDNPQALQGKDVLRMWMVEDLMRALHFDIDQVNLKIVIPALKSGNGAGNDLAWYRRVIDMMRAEHIEKSGHLSICRQAIERMTALHNRLLKEPAATAYHALYYDALPVIVDFRAHQASPTASAAPKTGNTARPAPNGERITLDGHSAPKHPEIESCLELLYGVRLLKMQGRPVSPATQDAADKVQALIDMLNTTN